MALCSAADHIRRGDAELMLAGGSDAAIIPSGIGGFIACKALSRRNEAPEAASRPWDKGRDGFVMGEGAGFLPSRLTAPSSFGGCGSTARIVRDAELDVMFQKVLKSLRCRRRCRPYRDQFCLTYLQSAALLCLLTVIICPPCCDLSQPE